MVYHSSMTHKRRTIPSEALDIAWLAGIFDGEGSIGMYPMRTRPGRFLLGATITNTDSAILDKIERIYQSLGIDSRRHLKVAWLKPHITSFQSRKPCYEIVVRRRLDIEKLLKLIQPILVGEKQKNLQRILKHLVDNPPRVLKARVTTKREAP